MRRRADSGKRGEDLAAAFLKKQGFEILRRNVRDRLGEIDIVAREGGTLVFVEVKSGRHAPGFSPAGHFDRKKRLKLLHLAKAYLAREEAAVPARFDLVSVIEREGKFHIDHFRDVLEDAEP